MQFRQLVVENFGYNFYKHNELFTRCYRTVCRKGLDLSLSQGLKPA
jgi:hypothetical protein